MRGAWYETFFRGVVVESWGKMVTPEWTAADVDFLEKSLAPPPGGRILDVPCGNGRHSIALASRGYGMTGVDISEEFLAVARRNAAGAGVACEFRQGDMRDLGWAAGAGFDAAFCFGNSFGYLDYTSACGFLDGLFAALAPGARIAIDCPTAAESLLPSLEPNRWHRLDDLIVLSENHYVAGESRLDIDYTFMRGGQSETRPAASYVHTIAELRRMLATAGYIESAAVGSASGEPFQIGSAWLVLTARKP